MWSAAALLVVSLLISGSQVDGVILKWTGRSVVLNFLGKFVEGLIYIFAVFCTNLKEKHIMLLSKSLSVGFFHFSLIFHIALGSNEYLADTLDRVAFYLFDP